MSKNIKGTAITIVVAAVSSLIGTFASQSLFNNDFSIDEELSNVSQKVNKNLPMEIDSETRLDATMSIGEIFAYKYTLINYNANEIEVDRFVSSLTPSLKNGYCTSDAMKHFLDKEVTLQYTYYDKEGKQITSIKVAPDDCKS